VRDMLLNQGEGRSLNGGSAKKRDYLELD